MTNKPDYFTMIFQISMVSKFSDEYLLGLSEEEVEKLWIEKVERKR